MVRLLFGLAAVALLPSGRAAPCSPVQAKNEWQIYLNAKSTNPTKACSLFAAYENAHWNENINGIMQYDSSNCATPEKKAALEAVQAAYAKEKAELCAGPCINDLVMNPYCPTTTLTPWDSSESSSDTDASASSYSSSFERDSSADSSGSAASGGSENSAESSMSGSSGFYMQLWQWLLFAAALCACCAIIAGLMKPKPKPKKKPAPPPPPVEEPMPELEPMIVQPVTTSYVMAPPMVETFVPSYGYAAPTTAYAQPMAAPMTTAYAPGGMVV